MTQHRIINDDVLTWADQPVKSKFHAMLCDPPYHLTSIVKRFGKKGSAPAKHGTDGVFQRSSSGFMGQEWDGGDIAFNPETWALLGEHLYDGAFGMAFAASRNWHRLAVAIEDAGFIIHPTIFLWAQGQGFPKATRIDKKANDERWSGHRYGLQALKPSVEPIIVFQKSYNGKPLDNMIETGAGALNIDGARIPLANEDDEYVINTFDDGAKPWGDAKGEKYTSRKVGKRNQHQGDARTPRGAGMFGEGTPVITYPIPEQGRWPANFMLTDETAEKMGEESRFFYTVSDTLNDGDPVFYCPKASPSEKTAGLDERSNHPTHKPIDLCRYLATLLLPPDMYAPRQILIPFSGVGSEMIGAGLAGWDRILGIEKDTEQGYIDIANKRLEHWLK